MLKDVAILDKDTAKIMQVLKLYYPEGSELLQKNLNMLLIEGVIEGLDAINPIKISLVAEQQPGFYSTRDQARMRDSSEQQKPKKMPPKKKSIKR